MNWLDCAKLGHDQSAIGVCYALRRRGSIEHFDESPQVLASYAYPAGCH